MTPKQVQAQIAKLRRAETTNFNAILKIRKKCINAQDDLMDAIQELTDTHESYQESQHDLINFLLEQVNAQV